MRIDYPQLDEDLHEQFNKKKEYIEGKREERKRARKAEFSAPDAVDSGFDNPNGPTDGGGWDSVNGAGEAGDAGDAGDGWNQAAAMVTAEEVPSWTVPSVSMW